MREAGRRSGYMPLSGTASGRPLMINSVSRRGHRQIILATFPRPKTAFPQLKSPFKATRRRNLSLKQVAQAAEFVTQLARVPHYAWLLPQALARTLPAARVDRAVDPAWRAIPARQVQSVR